MAIERIQGCRSSVLYIIFGVLNMDRVIGGSGATHNGESWDVPSHGDFHVTKEIARTSFVGIQAHQKIAQVADKAKIITQLRGSFIEFFLVGERLCSRKMLFSQTNRRAQTRLRVGSSRQF